MAESRETYAYFWVAADELPHNEISRLLGLEPTEFWAKGDPGNYVHQQKQARWVFHSPLPRTETFLDAHIEALVSALESSVESVVELGRRFEVGIQGVGYYTEANPGIHLSAELMSKLAKFSVAVDFDLYCLGAENESAV
jgi:hypothetical protein